MAAAIADPAVPGDPDNTGVAAQARSLLGQPAVRKALPAIAGIAGLALLALVWAALSEAPQRVLYASLPDADRAAVVATLDAAAIDYVIDPATGALSVGEDDLYRARMLVASDGSIAPPETGAQMLDSIPLGSSRTLEGERLRNVRERELMLTIAEIDGVESVRVHLAQPQRSAFLRENTAPSASVMVRLARGRSLSASQVAAIVDLVAGSVPGMTADQVRVADSRGNLLSAAAGGADSAGDELLRLQAGYEDKLSAQVDALLVPMLGEGRFSAQVQVELDTDEVTSARESYDKDGVVRSETQTSATRRGQAGAGGIPGVLANTPPPDPVLADGADNGEDTGAPAGGAVEGETSTRRAYELGREVAVTSNRPGSVARISVGVALSREALEAIEPATARQVEELVAAAVGADPDRGDTVKVITGAFEPVEAEETPFYETGWFAMVVRNAVALIAVLLGLFFGVRPVVRALTRRGDGDESGAAADATDTPDPIDGGTLASRPAAIHDAERLREQVDLAKSLAAQQPERAASALRRMLAEPDGAGAS